jgi:hypothetical protein
MDLKRLFLGGLIAMLLAVTPAQAQQTHLYQRDISSTGTPNGFLFMQGLAVGSSEELFAVDGVGGPEWSGLIDRFDSTGSYLGSIDGSGTPQGAFYVPVDVAVDLSGGPSDGNVYVTDTYNNVLDAFTPTGELVASFGSAGQLDGSETPAGAFALPCGVVVDQSNGNVFVADSGNRRVWIFDETGSYLGRIADSALNEPCGLGLDSSGKLYVRNQGSGAVLAFEPEGPAEYGSATVVEPGGATDVAVDPANDHVMVALGNRVEELDASGSIVGQFGEGALLAAQGIAVAASGEVFVSEWSYIHVFGPLVTVPEATTGEATGLTPNGGATLNGTVDPSGEPLTECKFEYGSDPSYGQEVPCAETLAEIGFGDDPVAVHADLSGLAPGATHFRLVVANANGTSQGEDRAFSAHSPPAVLYQGAAPIFTEATLKARLDSGGEPTSYHFEYGPTSAYGSVTPEKQLDAESKPVNVSATIAGLAEAADYHFRLVATNPSGAAEGPDSTFRTLTHASQGCANEAFRQGQGSTFLPDCRAYEMVTPVEKGAGSPRANGLPYAYPDGNAIVYTTRSSFPGLGTVGAPLIPRYLSERSPTGWTTLSLDGPIASPPHYTNVVQTVLGTSRDRTAEAVVSNRALLPGTVEGQQALYRRDIHSGEYTLIATSPEAAFGFLNIDGVEKFIGGSRDFSTIVFWDYSKLTPDAAPGFRNIYRWSAASGLTLVSVLADGTPQFAYETALSHEGEWIVFNTPGGLYLRKGSDDAVAISASQKTGAPDGPTPASRGPVSADGSELLFLAGGGLTDDAPAGGTQIYRYNLESGELTYVTDSLGGGSVELASEDLSYFYFTAGANTYLWHGGETTFVKSNPSFLPLPPASVSPNGRYYAFFALDPPDGYENANPDCAGTVFDPNPPRCKVLYLFDAETDEVHCVSCGPPGVPPAGDANAGYNGSYSAINYRFPQPITDEGRLFFDTPERLSPRDANQMRDVYEYHLGEVRMISRGVAGEVSQFADTGGGGRDVFFTTTDAIVGQERDNAVDVYDARVGGGFASQEPGPAPPVCGAGECGGNAGGLPDEARGATEGVRVIGNKPRRGCRPKASHRSGGKKKPCGKRKRHAKRRIHKDGRAGR